MALDALSNLLLLLLFLRFLFTWELMHLRNLIQTKWTRSDLNWKLKNKVPNTMVNNHNAVT
jgi:hypothetical protein